MPRPPFRPNPPASQGSGGVWPDGGLGSSLGASLAVHGAALATIVFTLKVSLASSEVSTPGERSIATHFVPRVAEEWRTQPESATHWEEPELLDETTPLFEPFELPEATIDFPFDDGVDAQDPGPSTTRAVESFVRNELVLRSPVSPEPAPRIEFAAATEKRGSGHASPRVPEPRTPRERADPTRQNSDPVPIESACEPPAYPAHAAKRKLTGTVYVWIDVAADGTVSDARMDRSSGHSILDGAALRAVRKWRFSPAVRSGVPIAMTVRKPIEFKLNS